MAYRILIVDDEPILTELLSSHLQDHGYTVSVANSSDEALAKLNTKPNLILLDINMPGMDGLELCKVIRNHIVCPILFLTARITEQDKVNGLRAGGDDYITKPFNPLELTARVRTQLRRYTRYNTAAPQQEQTEKDIRGLHMDKDAHHCSLNGQEVVLTSIEFNILWYLCERQGSVVSSEELFEAVWGEKYLDNNNTVMAHIARIREKLKEPARRPKYIKTVWGVGYTIE